VGGDARLREPWPVAAAAEAIDVGTRRDARRVAGRAAPTTTAAATATSGRSLVAVALEVQDGVELDAVGRHAGLAVLRVPTPTIVTFPASLSHDDDDTDPQLFRNWFPAVAIFGRLNGDAMHVRFGNSTIIVLAGASGAEITRWMSPSSSSFAWIGRAFSFQVWNSTRPVRGVLVPKVAVFTGARACDQVAR
jgi:hypothetical protein